MLGVSNSFKFHLMNLKKKKHQFLWILHNHPISTKSHGFISLVHIFQNTLTVYPTGIFTPIKSCVCACELEKIFPEKCLRWQIDFSSSYPIFHQSLSADQRPNVKDAFLLETHGPSVQPIEHLFTKHQSEGPFISYGTQ